MMRPHCMSQVENIRNRQRKTGQQVGGDQVNGIGHRINAHPYTG